jgi:DNA-binding beta-propeller fold protein YncE
MKRALVPVLALFAAGCHCSERISQSAARVRFEPRALTLGPTWVNEPVAESIVVKNDSRQKLTVRLAVAGPFTADTEELELPAGAAKDVTVRFPAEQPGMFVGKLIAVDLEAELELVGIAEAVPACAGVSACRASFFDKSTRACVESLSTDGIPCPVTDACAAAGACQAGRCISTPRACPGPADPCQVSACDPEQGCRFDALADGSACGAADCAGAHVCKSGACTLDTTMKPATCGMHPQSLWVKIPLTGTPFGLATDSSDTAYVGLATASQVARIDTAQGLHAGSVTVGSVPTGLVSDSSRVWVTNQGSQNLSIVDRASFTVSGAPVTLTMTPYIPALRGGFLYVSGAATSVLKLDRATNAVVSQVSGTWSHANGIAFHPTQSLMYVAARDTGEVTEVDLATFSIGRRFTPGQSPQGIVISPDGRELYVAREAGPLAVIDTATGMITDQVMSATGGFGLALTPDGAELWMTRPGAGSVARIDRATHAGIGTLTTGGSPRRVGFSSNGSVAVITNESGWVDLAK